VGWTQHGDRPDFKVVTGISAGALIAPFAFLGPQYDYVLKEVSVSIRPKDVFHLRGLLKALFSDAFADDGPLEELIGRFVTPTLLRAIAHEYERGRILLIGTTDLDAGQSVIWNMGAIATREGPGALRLFRQIILASASIPGVFPPVMIDVSVNGVPHQEMHVDGGVITQVFLFPQSFVERIAEGGADLRKRYVYVIRNGRVGTPWNSVPRRSVAVGERALDGLVDAQGAADLYRLQYIAREEREDFHMAYIGSDFSYPHHEPFDSGYVQQLYEYARSLAADGRIWHGGLPDAEASSRSDER
jgi:hypothetical protein